MSALVEDQSLASKLLLCFRSEDQAAVKAAMKASDDYLQKLFGVYLQNPFLELTDDEVALFGAKVDPRPLAALVTAREAASVKAGARVVVFCMPKSASSFVSSALSASLQIPKVSLTSFGSAFVSSQFGMNSREQELDELAIVKSAIQCPRGFQAQHHTRYSPYVAGQIRKYGLTPVVTVRNVLDSIVSFDDMMIQWRDANPRYNWVSDAQFSLPANYARLDPERRYSLLSKSLGIWLVNFFLSWTRCASQGIISPLFLRYEDDILSRARFVERLTEQLQLSEEQVARLIAYAQAPDPQRARLNVGRRGRGRERLPAETIQFLANYVEAFRDELSEEDRRYLLDCPSTQTPSSDPQ